jgi:diguanylate cyclase (GGDEF)-like protein
VVELALLAFALAGRINQERNQRLNLELQKRELERTALLAKERALELERLSNEQLERSVRERTDDLHKALAELSDMNRKLEQLNTQDPVTGVGNENSFVRALKQEWDRAYRAGESLALIVVELDGYRNVVADYGQVAAEECLKNVADILARLICRPADVITRYGDKVFGVLLPNTDGGGALFLARQIADRVQEKPFDFGICEVHASVSVGVASERPTKMDRYKELLLAAESAVYVAQNSGGNQIQLAKVQLSV